MPKVIRRQSSRGGHGLFATIAIPAGTQILSISKPLVTIPDDAHLQRTCSNCLHHAPDTPSILTTYSPPRKLSACLGCKVVRYCGKECQTEDWKRVHKHECKTFAKLPRVLPGSVRVAMRVLMQNAEDEVFTQCEDHVERFRAGAEGKRWEVVFVMGKGVHGYSGTKRGEEEVRRLYCAVLVNSVTLVTETFDPIGIAFDPLAASINHDCTPNAVMLFDGRKLQVRALEDIPANAEILISYIDNTAPRERRQLELLEKYFFTCTCSRCTNPTSPMDGFLCACGGVGIPTREQQQVLCNKCAQALPVTADMDVLEQAAWSALSSDKSEAMISILEHLHKSPVWPLPRQPLAALHLALVQSEYIPSGNWKRALLHYLLVYLRLTLVFYPQRFHPVRVVHGFTLANLLLQVPGADYGKVVWGLLCECAAQVGRSHGDGGGFASVVSRKREEVRKDLEKEEETRGWVGMKLGDIGLGTELGKLLRMVDGLVKELKRQ